MMKQLIIFLFAIIGVAYSQSSPTTAKQRFVNGIYIGTKPNNYFNAADSNAIYWDTDSVLKAKYKGAAKSVTFNSDPRSGYVPYTGADRNLVIGNFRVSARSGQFDSIRIPTSAGGVLVSNSGVPIASYGAGGSNEFTFNGFAGYNANRAFLYTARSFTDKNYVDSSGALRLLKADSLSGGYATWDLTKKKVDSLGAIKIQGSGTTTYIPKFTGSNTLGNSIMYESGGVTYVRGYLSVDPFAPVSPLSIIQVGQKSTLNSTDAKILVNNLYTDATSLNGHAFADNSALRRTTGLWAYAAFDGRVDIDGTGVNADHYVSFQSAPNYSHTGTMKDNFGTYTTTIQSNGTLTNNYGHYVANPIRTGGTMTNNYGIYIENQTAGSSNYSIYSVGGANYLGGFLQVAETITGDKTGANARFKGGGTGATDAGIYVNGSGDAFFADWDGTRGFVSLGNGNGYYFGGNFGVKTATPTKDFDVVGDGKISDSLTVGTIVKSGGTATEYLMADGSIRTNVTSSIDTGRAATQIVTGGTLNKVKDSITALFASGLYNPTVTNVSNITSSNVFGVKYTKIGNIVTVTGNVTVNPSSAASSYIRISLPFSSIFTDTYDLTGTGNSTINKGLVVNGDPVNNEAQFQFDVGSTASTNYNFTFTYIIK